jgi:hypothetical protein
LLRFYAVNPWLKRRGKNEGLDLKSQVLKFAHINCIIARLKLELARNASVPKYCGN